MQVLGACIPCLGCCNNSCIGRTESIARNIPVIAFPLSLSVRKYHPPHCLHGKFQELPDATSALLESTGISHLSARLPGKYRYLPLQCPATWKVPGPTTPASIRLESTGNFHLASSRLESSSYLPLQVLQPGK